MTTLLLALTLTLPVEPQTLVYCKHLETGQVQIFEGFCPAGWMFLRWV